MKKIAWVISLVAIISFMLAPATGNAQNKKVLELRATNTLPIDHPMNKGLQKMADGVKARTKGSITIKLFPNSQLGGNTEMVEGLQMGTIDICNQFAGAFANYVPEMEILALAFIFTSEDQMYKALNGRPGEILAKALREKGFEPLGYFFGGSRSLMNNVRPINTPKDLKGLKIRTIPTKITLEGINRMGGIATPMSQSEVYSALEQKVLDGWENSPTTLYTLKLHEVTKYVSMTKHFMTPDLVAISSKTWAKFSDAEKKIVKEEAKKAIDFERKLWSKNEAEVVTKLKAAGVKFNEVSDIKAFRVATKSLWDEYEAKYKNGMVAEIIKIK